MKRVPHIGKESTWATNVSDKAVFDLLEQELWRLDSVQLYIILNYMQDTAVYLRDNVLNVQLKRSKLY